MDAIKVRELGEREHPFLFSSWLNSYRRRSSFARRITDKVFFSRHHAVIERILQRPSTTVLVATPVGEPDTFLGYLIVERALGMTILHFAYVKDAWRRMGVMKALVAAAGIDPNACVFTHRTYDLEWIERKFPALVYDPYLI